MIAEGATDGDVAIELCEYEPAIRAMVWSMLCESARNVLAKFSPARCSTR
jgi:hypothetical protein